MFEQLRVVTRLIRKPMRGWITLAILGSLVLAALDTLGVAAMLPLTQLITGADPSTGFLGVVSDVVGTTDMEVLIPLVAGVVALAFILKSVGTIGFRWWLLGHTTGLVAEGSAELLRRYILSPFIVHRTRNLPEVYRNITFSVQQAFGQVLLGLITLMSDLLILFAIAVVLVIVSPPVSLFVGVFFFVLTWSVQRILRGRQTQIGQALSDAEIEGWQFLMPALDGFRESRLASSGERFVDGFAASRTKQARAVRGASLVAELPKYILEIGFVFAIMGASMILFNTSSTDIALSVLGVFAAASLRMLPTLNRVSATMSMVRSARVGLATLADAVRQLETDGTHTENRVSDVQYGGDIELRGIGFNYPDSTDTVLRDIWTSIPENRTTAFIGSSGAGKSTLLDIILGLLPPSSGEVRCGGTSIGDDPVAWYETLGVVPQEVFLLNDTIAANIAFGVPASEVDPARVAEAVEMAQLRSLVEDLPAGLDTVVGERGVRLSGGQRQRIGIARALYRRPSVLVLDEATSSLDNATEQQISATIESLKGRMTIILVAHRLSTVRNADKIVFMSSGGVETEGTFDEVRQTSVEFAHLVSLGQLT